jgi:hypothetical protein
MKSNKIILHLAIVAKLILSFFISSYFWNTDTLYDINNLPVYVLILCVAYIVLQMISRKISTAQHWWDWVYYLGLLCIMLPVMLANEESLKMYNYITDYGTLLLLIPVLVDGYLLIKPKSSQS